MRIILPIAIWWWACVSSVTSAACRIWHRCQKIQASQLLRSGPTRYATGMSASFSVVPSNAPAKIVSLCASKGFNVNGYEYQVTDDYNGEGKPAHTIQGLSVTAPVRPKEVSFVCHTKSKADYSDLPAVLPNGRE